MTYPGKKSGHRARVIAIVAIGALALAALSYVLLQSGGSGGPVTNGGGEITTPSGLAYLDLVEGTGPVPQKGQTVSVHYTGTLENGKKFDSSLDRNRPLDFVLGAGSVIKGWDEGIATMKVGGKRKLIVPPHIGYGAEGRPPVIPPNSTLIFEVELLEIK
jgi:peptidylprolyl isomerase